MVSKSLLYVLPAMVAAAAAVPHEKRDIVTNQTIYAYGTGITGFPIFADANGLAVIAENKDDSPDLASATWFMDSTGSSAWNVSLNATESGTNFYIVPEGEGYIQAGFASNETAPAGAATVGFVLYGSDIMFSTDDTYLYQFWATNTSDGLWKLTWNTDGDSEDGAVPIMLKAKAPSSD